MMGLNKMLDGIIDITAVRNAVENQENLREGTTSFNYFESEESPQDLIYSPWSFKFYTISKQGDSVTIDQKYLINFLYDQEKKRRFKKEKKAGDSEQYIGFGFMLELYHAKDASSGNQSYETLLSKLKEGALNGGLSIEGSEPIQTIVALNAILRKELKGFVSIDEELAG